MDLSPTTITTEAQFLYGGLCFKQPERRPWERLDQNQQRNYRIMAEHNLRRITNHNPITPHERTGTASNDS